MFFSNTDGVLTYDEKKWSLIQTPSQSVIRSMAMREDGKIFVGALDDFGYLDRLKNGRFTYISLLGKVKPELYEMGNIRQTYAHQNPDSVINIVGGRQCRFEILFKRKPGRGLCHCSC